MKLKACVLPVLGGLVVVGCAHVPKNLPVKLPPECPQGAELKTSRPMGGWRWECVLPDGKREGPLVDVSQDNLASGERYTTWEIHFRSDKMNGDFTYWHPNGTKGAMGSAKDGQPDATYTAWDENGQKRAQCVFEDGKAPKESNQQWDTDGKLAENSPCRSQDDVGQTLSTIHNSARDCYEKELAKDLNLAGEITTRFIIEPPGFTTSVKITESDMGNFAVEACLIQLLKRVRFPPSYCCGTSDVTYPWIFKSGAR